ncbi:ComF family protein [Antrihabitans cavernicola]|uniref:ComF family protein n=1 Tax=Antrihabitans cavernicola TaxID=2495913 RepID=A0A5A7SDI5_9NOCA|nr:ComF family protein [Spelaeibacter cavernicola]KAA0023986.1 ComF family protein [Spelaeibacter cavernicola]
MVNTLLDLILPLECAGCDMPGTGWCERCRDDVEAEPIRIEPRVDPGVPCWALGSYTGPRRRAVIAAKERGRRDLALPLGAALAGALCWLRRWGELSPLELAPLLLVPAPSRARAARMRGGDPVERSVRAAAWALEPERCTVAPVLGMQRGVRDSVGLSARERQANLAGRITVSQEFPRIRGAEIVLIDDVLTTGVTARESVSALQRVGLTVDAVVVVAAA